MTVSLLVPFMTATMDPFLPFAALDVRTVYNSPSESATSSSESLPERFSG